MQDDTEVKQADRSRQWPLEQEGILVVRFTKEPVAMHIKEVITTIIAPPEQRVSIKCLLPGAGG